MTEKVAEKITKSEGEWRKQLTPDQYHVTREAGTECAFTGAYWNTKDPGMYHCVCCGEPLFDSNTKFNSGTGWPSFNKPTGESSVVEHRDTKYGMVRTRGPLRQVRRASGACVRRWSCADRLALLHEFGRARFSAGREEVKTAAAKAAHRVRRYLARLEVVPFQILSARPSIR